MLAPALPADQARVANGLRFGSAKPRSTAQTQRIERSPRHWPSLATLGASMVGLCMQGAQRAGIRCTTDVIARKAQKTRWKVTRPKRPGVTGATQYEEAAMIAVLDYGGHDKVDTLRVLNQVNKMIRKPGPQGELNGDWQLKWNSNNGAAIRKTLLSFQCRAMPRTLVAFNGGYQRITDDMFYDVRTFRVPGHPGTQAAMVFSGPRLAISGQTFEYTFDRVRILPSQDWDAHLSSEMVQLTGLAEYAAGEALDQPGYFELEYLSTLTRVHRTETGVAVLTSRMEKSIPYDL